MSCVNTAIRYMYLVLLRENKVFINSSVLYLGIRFLIISFIEQLKFVQDGETPDHVMTLALKVKICSYNFCRRRFFVYLLSKLCVIAVGTCKVSSLSWNWLELIVIVTRI